MGREYDPQVLATFGEYENDQILAVLRQKEIEMARISHWSGLEYHIKILDSPVVNAFAVPGGYIYLTRGLLAQLNNEAELAGIIGHEMGHITARHSVNQLSKQQVGQLVLIAGMIASEEFRKLPIMPCWACNCYFSSSVVTMNARLTGWGWNILPKSAMMRIKWLISSMSSIR